MAGTPPDEPSMEVVSLFPRYLLQGQLPAAQLADLQAMARAVLARPERSPDASVKLAGQLSQQRELGPDHPAAAELCRSVILPACERWIRHVIDRQPPQGRGPWTPGRYGLQMIWARTTILASGGAGQLFRETSNPPPATADGTGSVLEEGPRAHAGRARHRGGQGHAPRGRDATDDRDANARLLTHRHGQFADVIGLESVHAFHDDAVGRCGGHFGGSTRSKP